MSVKTSEPSLSGISRAEEAKKRRNLATEMSYVRANPSNSGFNRPNLRENVFRSITLGIQEKTLASEQRLAVDILPPFEPGFSQEHDKTRKMGNHLLEELFSCDCLKKIRDPLTRAELSVAMKFVEGCSYREIATMRRVTRDTVKSQISKILAKTNSRNRAELIKVVILLNIKRNPIERGNMGKQNNRL